MTACPLSWSDASPKQVARMVLSHMLTLADKGEMMKYLGICGHFALALASKVEDGRVSQEVAKLAKRALYDALFAITGSEGSYPISPYPGASQLQRIKAFCSSPNLWDMGTDYGRARVNTLRGMVSYLSED